MNDFLREVISNLNFKINEMDIAANTLDVDELVEQAKSFKSAYQTALEDIYKIADKHSIRY